jgi:hypothetical protein
MSDEDNNRSRSLLRQVRETFGSVSRNRHHVETRTGSPSLPLSNNQRISVDSINTSNSPTKILSKKSTPNSFSRHLSLLNQVKSHITKTPKYRTTQSSSDNDDYTHLSLSPIISTSVSCFKRKFFFSFLIFDGILFSRYVCILESSTCRCGLFYSKKLGE